MTLSRHSQKLTVGALAILAGSCLSNNAQNSGSGGSRPSAGGASGGATIASSGGQVGTGDPGQARVAHPAGRPPPAPAGNYVPSSWRPRPQVGTGGSAPGVGGKGSGGSASGGAAGSASGGSGSGGVTSGAGGSSPAATGGSSTTTGAGGMAGDRSGSGGAASGGSGTGGAASGGSGTGDASTGGATDSGGAPAGNHLYVSPTGSGTTCSSAASCSITQAQTAVRALASALRADAVVELGDGTYPLGATLGFDATDSGTAGHPVVWQAATGAHPILSGAKKITGWTVSDTGKNIWKASAPGTFATRQLYVDGKIAVRARTEVSRSIISMNGDGIGGVPSAVAGASQPGRIEFHAIGSWTDRYAPVKSFSGSTATMVQPAWANNLWGFDTIPFRTGRRPLGSRTRTNSSTARANGTWTPQPEPSTTSRLRGRT